MDVLQLARQLDQPDIELAGLRIWVHARSFPQYTDYWDGNWVCATALCRATSAAVATNGTILHLGCLFTFRQAASRMHRELAGEAILDSKDPYFTLRLAAPDRRGHIDLIVEITPVVWAQRHRFVYEIDQSYLPRLIAECDAIFSRLPVRSPNK